MVDVVREVRPATSPAGLDLVLFFETTIADRTRGYVANVLAIPRRAIPETEDFDNAHSLSYALEGDVVAMLPSPEVAFLPHAVIALLAGQDSVPSTRDLLLDMLRRPAEDSLSGVEPGVLDFAVRVAFDQLIAFEASPLNKQSLACIGVGGTVAVTAVAGHMIILAVAPAAIIIIGVAAVISEAVQQRLRKLLRIR